MTFDVTFAIVIVIALGGALTVGYIIGKYGD